MGNDTIIRQFMPSVLQLNEGFPGIWTVVEGVVEVYVGRRERDSWSAWVGKVQGRNHGLKVGGSQKIFFRPREGEEREGAQVQIGTPKVFFSFIIYLF